MIFRAIYINLAVQTDLLKRSFLRKIITFLLLVVYCNCFAQVRFIQPNMKKADEPLVYLGINNYFVIQNAGATKILSIQVKEGKVERLTDTTFHFNIKTASANGIQFTYNWVKDGKLQKNILYPVIYKTAVVPDIARIRLGTKSNGKISLVELKTVSRVALDDRDFQTKLNYNILCELSCKPLKAVEKYIITIRNGDLKGNVDFQELLGKLTRGDKIRFDKIRVLGNNNTAKTLESTTFTIE